MSTRQHINASTLTLSQTPTKMCHPQAGLRHHMDLLLSESQTQIIHGLATATMKVWNSKVACMQSINPSTTTQNINTTTHSSAMATTKVWNFTQSCMHAQHQASAQIRQHKQDGLATATTKVWNVSHGEHKNSKRHKNVVLLKENLEWWSHLDLKRKYLQ